ncbi:UNVERIFIED_ORG: hypothetical protein ABIC54_004476 [Burkholderia sp. 1263]
MRRIIFLLALLPSLAVAQLSIPYNPANVKITGGTAAFTGTVSTTGNVNVQGNVSSASNTQPASPTNSGVALNATPNIADVQMFDSTQTANNRTAEWIFWSGTASLRFANDAHSQVATPFSVTGGQASGITAINSNSGTGSWTHTGNMAVSGTLLAGNGTLNVYSASGVAVTTPHVVTGTVTLASGNGTATFTGNAVFSNTTSYVCTATNTTTNSAVRATNASASSITFNSGAGTDVIAYQCVGN